MNDKTTILIDASLAIKSLRELEADAKASHEQAKAAMSLPEINAMERHSKRALNRYRKATGYTIAFSCLNRLNFTLAFRAGYMDQEPSKTRAILTPDARKIYLDGYAYGRTAGIADRAKVAEGKP